MGHYAKPGNEPAFLAQYNANRKVWQVVGPDGVIEGGDYTNERYAKGVARQKNGVVVQTKHRSDRPCMCCQKPFPSEGIHNRLCPNCRLRGSAEAMPAGYSFGSMTGRRKSA
ncbi:MAG: hypothetical protein ACOH2H_15175 [Cypionkella sp.]